MKIRTEIWLMSFCLFSIWQGTLFAGRMRHDSGGKSLPALNKQAANQLRHDTRAVCESFNKTKGRQLDRYISELLKQTHVPGASVAIVQNGKVVYAKGFGVRAKGAPGRVSPKTLMMIGSMGKSMTAMMTASMIDDGYFTLDTPVVRLYPKFEVSDPAITSKVTLRDLLGNRTGLQRHDLEFVFAQRQPNPPELINDLRHFAFENDFRTKYGYVNQAVAAAGFIAAGAVEGRDNLYGAYTRQMQRRVFDPIGMRNTSFSFGRVRANSDHATPHGLTARYEYVRLPLDLEQRLQAVAPAGASWSNVEDMARYLITQMSRGIAPNGRQVVSAANLTAAWQPQVAMEADASYGMGWIITSYNGNKMITHGGGTYGFTSDMTLFPDARLGIVVLTNAQSNLLAVAARNRILELVFGQRPGAEAKLSDRIQANRQSFLSISKKAHRLTPSESRPYEGTYANPALGTVRIEYSYGSLKLHAGGFTSEIRYLDNESFVLWDPPLAGSIIKFTPGEPSYRSFLFRSNDPDMPNPYRFTSSRGDRY